MPEVSENVKNIQEPLELFLKFQRLVDRIIFEMSETPLESF